MSTKAPTAKRPTQGKEVSTDIGAGFTPLSAGLPAHLQDSTQHNRGSEAVGVEDLVIPRLEIVQALSPCLKRSDPAYIDGIEQGHFYNTVTRENYGPVVYFVPVVFRKEFLVWRDRKLGGGFRGAYQTFNEANLRIAEEEKPSEWAALDTGQQFGLVVKNTAGRCDEIVLSMSKSKLKVSKRFNSAIKLIGGDRFSRVYKITGVPETNDKNQEYWNLSITPFGFPGPAIYKAAEQMWRSVNSGDRNVVTDTTGYVEEEVGSGEY